MDAWSPVNGHVRGYSEAGRPSAARRGGAEARRPAFDGNNPGVLDVERLSRVALLILDLVMLLSMRSTLVHEVLSERIIGAAIAVHRTLGPGLLEA